MISSREMLLADRMQRRVQSILQGGEEAQSAADGLQRDAQFYGARANGPDRAAIPTLNIRAMDNANAKEILADINDSWAELSRSGGQAARFRIRVARREAGRRSGLAWTRRPCC